MAPQHGTGGKLLLGGAFGLESRVAYGGSWAAAESASGSGGYRDLVLGASVFRAGRSQKGRNAPGAALSPQTELPEDNRGWAAPGI